MKTLPYDLFYPHSPGYPFGVCRKDLAIYILAGFLRKGKTVIMKP
jgi:hypothetical protein